MEKHLKPLPQWNKREHIRLTSAVFSNAMSSSTIIASDKVGKPAPSLISERDSFNPLQLGVEVTSMMPSTSLSQFSTISTLLKSKRQNEDVELPVNSKKRRLIERIGEGTTMKNQKLEESSPKLSLIQRMKMSPLSSEPKLLTPDIRETYQQLENFAADPKSVINDILSTPGCPPFPPSKWLNVI
ncbi:hypothetical protein EV424DRAFT_1342795 [Suillus variegatus]|nr:hypothetical protein EV424DRAFT_1342795 [Suillus variegatus]